MLCLYSAAGLGVATIVYIGEFHSHHHRTLIVTLAVSGFPLAKLYKALLAYLELSLKFHVPIYGDLELTAWRTFVLGSSPIILFAFIAIMLLPQSPKFMLLMGRKEECINILRRMYVMNSREPPEVLLHKLQVS